MGKVFVNFRVPNGVELAVATCPMPGLCQPCSVCDTCAPLPLFVVPGCPLATGDPPAYEQLLRLVSYYDSE